MDTQSPMTDFAARAFVLSTFAAIGLAPSFALGQTFTGLGTLPGYGDSIATAISADGRTVVGSCSAGSQPQHAFVWTRAHGMVDLGTLPGDSASHAASVSADGSVVAGLSILTTSQGSAVLWSVAPSGAVTGITPLGTPSGWGYSAASAVSADGHVVAGTLWSVDFSRHIGFRWTAQSGFTMLGSIAASGNSVAFGLSADGSIVSGYSDAGSTFSACLWGPSGAVADLSAGDRSYARALSADGTIAVGYAEGEPSRTGFRWRAGSGASSIGPANGAGALLAFAVSADGRVIAGTGDSSNGGDAVVFIAPGRLVNLNVYLAERGVDLSHWHLSGTYGLSADGRVVAGYGFHDNVAEGFVAELPGWCGADFNGDGVGDGRDVLDFVNAWLSLEPAADFNGVGGVTAQDIFDFLSAWFVGC